MKDLVNLKIERKRYWELVDYLKMHESDISHSINDFGDLKKVFLTLFGRQAESE
jgi:hypothetical protein